jgi:hypothetical protein
LSRAEKALINLKLPSYNRAFLRFGLFDSLRNQYRKDYYDYNEFSPACQVVQASKVLPWETFLSSGHVFNPSVPSAFCVLFNPKSSRGGGCGVPVGAAGGPAEAGEGTLKRPSFSGEKLLGMRRSRFRAQRRS